MYLRFKEYIRMVFCKNSMFLKNNDNPADDCFKEKCYSRMNILKSDCELLNNIL